MTASLPVPHDPPSDDEAGQARTPKRGPRALPPPAEPVADDTSPEDAVEEGVPAEPAPAPRPRKPRAPRTTAPRPRTSKPPEVLDPGPPPPLPADLDTSVVPPLPPLSAADAAAVAATTAATEIVIPPKPPAPVKAVQAPTGPAPDVVVEPEDLSAPVLVDPPAAQHLSVGATEPVVVDEPVAESEPALRDEPVALDESTVVDGSVAESGPVVVDESVAEAEPTVVDESVAESGPVGLDEPVADVEPALLEEPVAGGEVLAVAELYPAPVIEQVNDAAPAVAAVASVFDADLTAASVDLESAALSVQGVTKSFGATRAVDGIDLVVPPGIVYGLVGPNGAGKTTTLSMIAGLLRPDRGTITVAGVDAAAKPRAAKKLMGVLPDRLRTFDRLTGRQLLYYFGVLRGLAPAVVESRTADLARAFDLADALGRPVSDYSAGMTKKVMLAGAMIHSPRLLVLDEPFESVDPVSSGVILDILGAYVAHGGTVILSSHGMDLVERVCSRVAVMVAGQVLAEGTVEDVRGELTLEQRFVELAGGLSDVEGLEWLHTFSG